MRIPSFQQITETIRQKMVNNLAAQSGDSSKKLYNALEMVNQSTMWRLVQWMHETILPKVLQHRGAESNEFKNYTEIEHSLVWAMYILQQYETLLLSRGKDRQLLKFYQSENARLERELMKFATMAELSGHEAIDIYKTGLVKQALELITAKPKTTDNENAK